LEEYLTPGGEFYSSSNNFYNAIKPGTSFNYCNIGVALVGYLVEILSDKPFDEYCQMYIFDPLYMDETAWFLKDLNIDNIAIPYDYNDDWDLEAYEHYGKCYWPSTQLRTSSLQLCNFMISMLNDGTFESNSILNEETVDLIFSPQFTDIPGAIDMIGIIWWGEDDWDELYWSHIGSSSGVSTKICIYPSDDIGIIVLTNGPEINPLDYIIIQLYNYGKEITNKPPANPTVKYVKANNELVVKSVDPDNDQIRFGVSWENNQNVDYWTDYNNSNIEIRVDCDDHKSTIGVIAEDEYGGQSEWISVSSKSIQLSCNFFESICQHLFYRLIQRFPILDRLIL
jgi:CubicO group peptidase (beta-lactamase class C family)